MVYHKLVLLLLLASLQFFLGQTVHGFAAPRVSSKGLLIRLQTRWNVETTPRCYSTTTIRSTAKDDPTTAKSPSSSLRLPLKIGGFYGALGLMVVQGVRKRWLAPKEAMAGCSLLWLGFVLAISFTEAWVKFRAPFLPKHYGLDVGRTVFPVLNAIEVACCSNLWVLQRTYNNSKAGLSSSLACATLILLSQALYFTPQLVLLGKHVIADAFPEADPTWSPNQRQLYGDLCTEVKAKARPSSKLHIVYVLQEFVKVMLIGKLVWSCRSLVLQ